MLALRHALHTRRVVVGERGQALPIAVIFILAIAALGYFMINSGELVGEKIRATNAADAAAYSAATVEARALNYDAVSNRAMIANQMAIAQIVSVVSWANYFGTGVDFFSSSSAPYGLWKPNDHQPNGAHKPMSSLEEIATVSAAFVGAQYVSQYFGGNVSQWVQEYSPYLGIAISIHSAASDGLALSQRLMHAGLALGDPQRGVANDVAQRTDPKLRADIVRPTHGFLAFTHAYGRQGDSGDERGRFAEVAMNSRSEFVRQRNWTAEAYSVPFFVKDVALKKRGGTDLIDYDEWRAVDTLEHHANWFGCGRFIKKWCGGNPSSAAWGAAEVDAGDGDQRAGYHGNAYSENRQTAYRSEQTMIDTARFRSAMFGVSPYSGLPQTRDLADLKAPDPKTGITVRVYKAQRDTLTSGNAAIAAPSGRLAMFEGAAAGARLTALARAEVYFDRVAARADGRTEIGSLYGPYWRVHLVAPLAADRAWAAAEQGGVALP